jgi:hypothetical protein
MVKNLMLQGFSSGGPFLDQHRQAPINHFGQLGVPFAAEDGAGARIGVEQGNIGRA